MFLDLHKKGKINFGIFGYRPIAEGLYDFLTQRPFLNFSLDKICAGSKPETYIPGSILTNDPDVILYSKEINVVIELLDNADAALNMVHQSLLHGKTVIASNVEMTHKYYYNLAKMNEKYNGKLLLNAEWTNIENALQIPAYQDDDLYDCLLSAIINESKQSLCFFN